MPSGAKKRKADKKKLQKVANKNGSHSQGVDDPKCHERSSDGGGEVGREGSFEGGGEVGREGSFEGGGVNHDEEGEMVSEGNVAGTDDVSRELQSDDKKGSNSSSSSSGSNSDGDEVVVEKEKLAEAESTKELLEVEATVENQAVSGVVDEATEESIPFEESVKQVVSLPQQSATVIKSVPVEHLSTSDPIESGLKQNVEEDSHLLDDKTQVGSGADLMPEKFEVKAIPVVVEGSENPSAPVDIIAREDKGLLPQSSSVKAVGDCCVDDNGKASETHQHAEEVPLISGAPLPLRQTSWLSCCGLFEVFSGGS